MLKRAINIFCSIQSSFCGYNGLGHMQRGEQIKVEQPTQTRLHDALVSNHYTDKKTYQSPSNSNTIVAVPITSSKLHLSVRTVYCAENSVPLTEP